MIATSADLHNRLLRALSPEGHRLVFPHLERVELRKGDVLHEAGEPIRSLYFVERGMVSLVKHLEDGRAVEVSPIGIEGVTGAFALFNSGYAIVEAVVQLPGSALRAPSDEFRRLLNESAEVRDVMHRYFASALSQVVQTCACNSLHSLEQRCARWLLVAHDNALSDTFALTHEFLAMMLGAHRTSVSLALGILERAGLVVVGRGRITITNRARLEEAACECYRTIRDEIEWEFNGVQ